CQAGLCAGTNPVTCAPADQCHDAGTCDPATGTCSNPAKPDGTACNDGNACTRTDTCQAGLCSGTNPVTCAPADQCHDAGTCDPEAGLDEARVDTECGPQQALALRGVAPEDTRQLAEELALADQRVGVVGRQLERAVDLAPQAAYREEARQRDAAELQVGA